MTTPLMTPKQADRFWSHVTKTDKCWLWNLSVDRKGYGQVRVGSRTMRAHRVAYELTHGPIGPHFACHTCDNPRCVRPDHIFLGSNLDNVRDMDAKGRRRTVVYRGADHPNARLTEDDVRSIRAALAAGATIDEVANRYPVSCAAIGAISSGRTWRHVA